MGRRTRGIYASAYHPINNGEAPSITEDVFQNPLGARGPTGLHAPRGVFFRTLAERGRHFRSLECANLLALSVSEEQKIVALTLRGSFFLSRSAKTTLFLRSIEDGEADETQSGGKPPHSKDAVLDA